MPGLSRRKIFSILISVAVLLFHSGCGKKPVVPGQGNGGGKKQTISQEADSAVKKSGTGVSSAEVQSSESKKPLKVLERTPSPGKNDVVINDPIAVVFSEAVDAKTADGAFSVISDKGEKIAGHVICKGDTVIFKTDNDLEYGVKYRVRVSRKISGKNGARISKDIEWNFATNQAIMARLRVKNGDSIILSDITGYDFYDQEINMSTQPVPFTLRNEGNAKLVIKSIEFSSGDANQFMLSRPALPVTLEPDKEIRISVSFTPRTGGKKTAVLKIKSNDGVMGFFHLLMTGKGI